jgi:DNA modification methylase
MNNKNTRRLAIEHVSIDELHPDPTNPRRINDGEMEALMRSMREFGFIDPVIVRREDSSVIGGHQRLVAARKLGIEDVPVIFVELSPERSHLLNLALNRISGSWDEDLLARLLADLGAMPDVDLSLSGFEDDEIKDLLRLLDAREKRDRSETFDVEYALEETDKEPRTAPGDVWQLGEHRLLCGDATDHEDVEKLLQGRAARMAFTDPPYNVDYGHHGNPRWKNRRKKIANDALSPEAWEEFVRAWASNLIASVKGAIYVCMSGKEWPVVTRVLGEVGGHWSTTVIWAKLRFTLGRSDYQRKYEPIWYGWPEGSEHHWCGDRDQGDVWTFDRPSSSEAHPTMKPLDLVERAIGNSSEVGDLVLDLFLGSGTTIIASERTGRICYGVEIDPHYCDVVVARWESFTGEKAVRA